jgi:hypothetical protein
VPTTDFTDRVPLPLRTAHGAFDPEPGVGFKTPSLLFVGGTPPYYHDGAALSLAELVQKNGTTMGDTARLSVADQQALAAYLRTLGGYVEPFPEEAPPMLHSAPAIHESTEPLARPPARRAWAGAEFIARNDRNCRVRRIDAWVRIDCPSKHELVMIAGSQQRLQRWSGPPPYTFGGGAPTLVFPLRAGDRRVVQLVALGEPGRWGFQSFSAGVLSAHWLEGDPAPTIILD